MPTLTTSTVAPSGKQEMVLALTIVLVVLIIILIISVFLLLYCVLKRQEGRIERGKRNDYEQRRRHRMQPKRILSDSMRKAKVSKIAASIEAAVKSSESTSGFSKPSIQSQLPVTLPAPPPTAKPIMSKRLPEQLPVSETAVEAPSLFINQIYVSRWRNPWLQVEREPSDFSYELESDSVNDDVFLQP
uniref:Uncharacterized protein n=1 Tax=Setaria digitata TaxID=48799 RepID=A0A915PM27_9BILA